MTRVSLVKMADVYNNKTSIALGSKFIINNT